MLKCKGVKCTGKERFCNLVSRVLFYHATLHVRSMRWPSELFMYVPFQLPGNIDLQPCDQFLLESVVPSSSKCFP